MPKHPEAEGLSLGELIHHVASELREARRRNDANADPVLDFSGCELEMAVTFKVEGKAGLKIWIVEAGFSGDRETVSKVKLIFGKPANTTVQFSAEALGEELPNPKREKKLK